MPSEFQHFLQFITSLRYDFDLNLRLQRVLSTLTKEDFVQFCLEKIVHQEKRKQVTAAILACPTSPRMCSINLQAEERNFVGLGAQVISIKKLRSWKGKQSYFPCDPTIKACQTCT